MVCEEGTIMSILYFRCPCCNEELDEFDISMYDVFGGMKEQCYNESMEAAYYDLSLETLQDIELDTGE